ncbi:formate dehydrogenase accessory sulfurtransferase FdhD [Lujinxingia litoralis]|uniref:Sulfur carrier protein FdhD n=1 Tax=Lujinxingia litoralis TaxID=2211119 RepID=A0A328C2X7_9DELT|nr:formate dehydrogenase accessory sulfurtransferase FdhD [Lujinxingia litoralis]RAL20265.1 formate dehydrogenase accessory sulfurtransferase FdhD [Lujinxingia litoralis]
MSSDASTRAYAITRVYRDHQDSLDDELVIEEPMELRIDFELAGHRAQRSLAITMRTPGDDPHLARGFLLTEGIISKEADLLDLQRCSDGGDEASPNIWRATLAPGCNFDPGRLQRHFYSTSSCGVCGKASLDALHHQGVMPVTAGPVINADLLFELPDRLRAAQATFDRTGGLHACALFSPGGQLLDLAEDVGRHNALDKLLGRALRQGLLPLSEHILLLSGRASFELIQKSLVAGIPIVAAVGAPSSLALDLSQTYAQTLVGFLRDQRLNLYTHPQRLRCPDERQR